MTNDYLENTAKVWCPNYPRRVATDFGGRWGQVDSYSQKELLHNISQVDGSYPGYVSTYSFPNGHPSNDLSNIPKIDTLMIDFDFEFNKNQFTHSEWRRKLDQLLTGISRISESLVENDLAKYWRGSLSGFKGVHLYLDFPPIDDDLGTPEQYRIGMSNFTDQVISSIKEETNLENLDEIIDVSSGWDLSRLTRLPNTVHEKATNEFKEERYCVPVSIKELQSINVPKYVALTRNRRLVPEHNGRLPNSRTGKVLERFVKTSPKNKSGNNQSRTFRSDSNYNEYVDDEVNERVELDDVRFLLSRKPCIWAFHENSEKYDHGSSSHIMEMQCIIAMSNIGTPIEVMKEFFKYHPEQEVHPKYDETETKQRIKSVLSHDYSEFNCSSVLEDAPQFCLKNDCKIYRDSDSLKKIH